MEFRTPLAGLISIHAPRMGSDKSPRRNSDSFYAFQSTLPGWGATYFNMRYRTLDMISIHAPRMGSDYGTRYNTAYSLLFQSTLPGWGATHYSDYRNRVVHISIHAPRMGSDITPIQWRKMTFISIHAPRMGSDDIVVIKSVRFTISIHAPRMGSDFGTPSQRTVDCRFQSTLPGWGATFMMCAFNAGGRISIHAPRMGSDISATSYSVCSNISIHAPRMGSDRENGHLRPRYGQNHPFSTLIVSQIVVDVLGTVRKSQKHQRTSHYEVIKQPERQK